MIYGATGHFGSGKSALVSYIVHERYISRGVPTWANYHLRGAELVYEVGSVEERTGLYGCRGGCVVLDEIQETVDSRNINKGEAGTFLRWFNQCRKMRSDLFVVSQQLHKVDKRVREQIDIEFFCLDVGEGRQSVTEVTAIDHRGQYPQQLSKVVFDRRQAFDLYDTDEFCWPIASAAPQAGGGRRR